MTAALGADGWEIRTWGGESPREKSNERFLQFFSWISFFFAVLSFRLKG
ncbi:MAG: hypothetical protein M1114_05755 [Candidatus Dependentiae bacterium]|nr:hypothetical protein [Candidatus Dependentiae bacterium]